MIRLTDFSIGYGSRKLLSDVGANIGAGKLTALIGRNGTGKSTLLRAIAGLNPHYSGTIGIDGCDIRRMSPRQMARTLALVTTERTRIPDMTCRDVVAMGRAPYTNWIGRMSPGDERAVDDALARTGMSDYASRTMDKMSDGECQRIMIARALAQDTKVILLDEPTSFLDMPNRYELCTLLGSLAREKGKCVLFSTHELDIAMGMCDCVALIDSPRLWVLPPAEMERMGLIDRLFAHSGVPSELYRRRPVSH